MDEKGQVHFSDTPPVGTHYEVVPAPAHPAASVPAVSSPPGPPAEPATNSEEKRAATETLPPAHDETKCVDALYQIALLGEKRRVFRLAPDGNRIYIEDADRPAEIERLSRQRDENCSDDFDGRLAEQRLAGDLMENLSPDCQSAREKLRDAQSPSTRTPASEVDRQRQYVKDHCPGVERTDLWMADWMFKAKEPMPRR